MDTKVLIEVPGVKEFAMWYFSWILGLGLALTFGVLNAIWYDVLERQRLDKITDTPKPNSL
jgi:cytochrome bd-I ubiquinol oxidase subunit X